jgi:hypothetical protein
MQSNIYIISYKRWDSCYTYDFLKTGNIVVPKSQEEQYRNKYGDAVLPISDNLDGTVAKKRNATLDLIKKHSNGKGWMLDDDIQKAYWKKPNRKLTGDEFVQHMERLEIMANDSNCNFAGFDYTTDMLKYKDFQPFSLNKRIFHCLYINTNDQLMFDHNLIPCEDLDFFYQKINNSRHVWKDNRIAYVTQGDEGGANSVIGYSKKEQINALKRINNKWGMKLFSMDKNGKYQFKMPIKGV